MYEDMAESVNEEVPLAHQKREALPSVVSQGGASCRHFSLTASRSATSTTGQRVSSPAACASASKSASSFYRGPPPPPPRESS